MSHVVSSPSRFWVRFSTATVMVAMGLSLGSCEGLFAGDAGDGAEPGAGNRTSQGGASQGGAAGTRGSGVSGAALKPAATLRTFEPGVTLRGATALDGRGLDGRGLDGRGDAAAGRRFGKLGDAQVLNGGSYVARVTAAGRYEVVGGALADGRGRASIEFGTARVGGGSAGGGAVTALREPKVAGSVVESVVTEGVVQRISAGVRGPEVTWHVAGRVGEGDLSLSLDLESVAGEVRADGREGRETPLRVGGERAFRVTDAVVVDARGRRAEIAPTFDGATMTVTVASSWLDRAMYPVVIDPVFAPEARLDLPGPEFSGATFGNTDAACAKGLCLGVYEDADGRVWGSYFEPGQVDTPDAFEAAVRTLRWAPLSNGTVAARNARVATDGGQFLVVYEESSDKFSSSRIVALVVKRGFAPFVADKETVFVAVRATMGAPDVAFTGKHFVVAAASGSSQALQLARLATGDTIQIGATASVTPSMRGASAIDCTADDCVIATEVPGLLIGDLALDTLRMTRIDTGEYFDKISVLAQSTRGPSLLQPRAQPAVAVDEAGYLSCYRTGNGVLTTYNVRCERFDRGADKDLTGSGVEYPAFKVNGDLFYRPRLVKGRGGSSGFVLLAGRDVEPLSEGGEWVTGAFIESGSGAIDDVSPDDADATYKNPLGASAAMVDTATESLVVFAAAQSAAGGAYDGADVYAVPATVAPKEFFFTGSPTWVSPYVPGIPLAPNGRSHSIACPATGTTCLVAWADSQSTARVYGMFVDGATGRAHYGSLATLNNDGLAKFNVQVAAKDDGFLVGWSGPPVSGSKRVDVLGTFVAMPSDPAITRAVGKTRYTLLRGDRIGTSAYVTDLAPVADSDEFFVAATNGARENMVGFARFDVANGTTTNVFEGSGRDGVVACGVSSKECVGGYVNGANNPVLTSVTSAGVVSDLVVDATATSDGRTLDLEVMGDNTIVVAYTTKDALQYVQYEQDASSFKKLRSYAAFDATLGAEPRQLFLSRAGSTSLSAAWLGYFDGTRPVAVKLLVEAAQAPEVVATDADGAAVIACGGEMKRVLVTTTKGLVCSECTNNLIELGNFAAADRSVRVDQWYPVNGANLTQSVFADAAYNENTGYAGFAWMATAANGSLNVYASYAESVKESGGATDEGFLALPTPVVVYSREDQEFGDPQVEGVSGVKVAANDNGWVVATHVLYAGGSSAIVTYYYDPVIGASSGSPREVYATSKTINGFDLACESGASLYCALVVSESDSSATFANSTTRVVPLVRDVNGDYSPANDVVELGSAAVYGAPVAVSYGGTTMMAFGVVSAGADRYVEAYDLRRQADGRYIPLESSQVQVVREPQSLDAAPSGAEEAFAFAYTYGFTTEEWGGLGYGSAARNSDGVEMALLAQETIAGPVGYAAIVSDTPYPMLTYTWCATEDYRDCGIYGRYIDPVDGKIDFATAIELPIATTTSEEVGLASATFGESDTLIVYRADDNMIASMMYRNPEGVACASDYECDAGLKCSPDTRVCVATGGGAPVAVLELVTREPINWVSGGAEVTVSAEKSSDAGGTIVEYYIECKRCVAGDCTLYASLFLYPASPKKELVGNYEPGKYECTVRVTDDDALSSTSGKVGFEVVGALPVALGSIIGGADVVASAKLTQVTLEGVTSNDPDGGAIVDYKWEGSNKTDATSFSESGADLTYYTPFLTRGEWNVTLTVTDDEGQTGKTSFPFIIRNNAPVASGCTEGCVTSIVATGKETTVKFSSSGTGDVEGDTLTYEWVAKQGANTVTFSGENPSAKFGKGQWDVTLTVTDDPFGDRGTAEFSFTILGTEPTAVAKLVGESVRAATGVETSVTFDGSSSFDTDGDAIASYDWTFSGGAGGPVFATGKNPTVKLGKGTWDVSLTVKDGEGNSGTDYQAGVLQITNNKPVAEAGPDIAVDSTGYFTEVKMNGSGSSDIDDTTLSYVWDIESATFTYGVDGSFFLEPGIYTVTLTVTDGDLATATDTLKVTVRNAKPTAVIDAPTDGFETQATGPLTFVALTGVSSSDSDGFIAAYDWKVTQGATVLTADGAYAGVDLAKGVWEIELTVTDNKGEKDTTSVTATITNSPPSAFAYFEGDSIRSATGVLTDVVLDGSFSSDVDGDRLTYSWSLMASGRDAVTTSGVKPTVSLLPGLWEIELTVTDAEDEESKATVYLEILPLAPTASFVVTTTACEATGLLTSVAFDASASTSGDGSTLNYYFAVTDSSSGDFVASSSGADPVQSLLLPKGDYTITLTVTNESDEEDSTSTTWEVCNSEPTVDAGRDRFVPSSGSAFTEVTMAATASDVDGDTLSVQWFEGTGAFIGAKSLTSALSLNKGLHVLRVEVTDSTTTVSDEVEITIGNATPTAVAFFYPSSSNPVNEGTTFQVVGAGSTDPDNDLLTYEWRQKPGDTALVPELIGGSVDGSFKTFTAPLVDADTVVTLQLRVSDGEATSEWDDFEVQVRDTGSPLPVAVIEGPTGNVGGNEVVQLSGLSSTSPDGTVTGYTYTQTGGPTVAVSEVEAGVIEFTTPRVKTGELVALEFQLVVTNATGPSLPTKFTVTADDRNNDRPVADAGDAATVDENVVVQLDGTGSFDPDGDTLTYFMWRVQDEYASLVTLDDPATATPKFTTPRVPQGSTTAINFYLTVGTGSLRDLVKSDESVVTVTVQDTVNSAPVVTVAEYDGFEGDKVRLEVVDVTDADGDATTVTFTQTGGEPVTIRDNEGSYYFFEAPRVPNGGGIAFTFFATATDGIASGDSRPFVVTVLDTFNDAPIADAGDDQFSIAPSGNKLTTVSLDGSRSSDADGDVPLTYDWSLEKEGTLYTASGETTTIDLPKGLHVVELEVCDGALACGIDDVTIEVLNAEPLVSLGGSRAVPSSGAATTNVLVTATASDPDEDTLTYTWTVDDVVVDGAMNDAETFALGKGDHTVTVAVFDGETTVTDTITVTVGNAKPEAVATTLGGATSVSENAPFGLDGTASSDVDGDDLSYTWVQTEGPAVVLDLTNPALPTFTTPLVSDTTTLKFTLTVNDGTDDSLASVVSFVVEDVLAPVARIDAPTAVGGGDVVELDGSRSSTPVGEISSFAWRQTSGPTVALSSTSEAKVSFTAPRKPYDATLSFGFELVVGDERPATSAPATVTVTVDDRNNVAPVADAGDDQTVDEDTLVTLDGLGSFDADGDAIVRGEWKVVAGDVVLDDPATATPRFVAPRVAQGQTKIVRVSLTVFTSDGAGGEIASESDEVEVTVRDAKNSAPTIVGGAFSGDEAAFIALPTLATADADGDAVTTDVKQTGGPTVALVEELGVTGFFGPRVPQGGSVAVEFTYTPSDGLDTGTPATATVTVVDATNDAPVAVAGDDQLMVPSSGLATTTVSLDGSLSSDADGDSPLAYTWSATVGGSPVTAMGETTTIALPKGVHVVTLNVSDGLASGSDALTVEILNAAPTVSLPDDFAVLSSGNATTDVLVTATALDSDGDGLTLTWFVDGKEVPGAATGSETFALAKGAHVVTVEAFDGTDVASDSVTVTVGNARPVAVAKTLGDVTTVAEVTAFGLDGSASSDVDGDDITDYQWVQMAGPTIAGIDFTDPAKPTFTTPAVATNTLFTFDLVVSDGTDSSVAASVSFTVTDRPLPVAAIDGPSLVGGTELVTLDGSGSTASLGSINTWLWKQTGGPAVTLAGNGTASVSFNAPRVPYGAPVALTFTLEVTDDNGTSAPATKTVDVDARNNVLPVADAGDDQTLGDGPAVVVKLDGRGSFDADGDAIVTYAWVQTGGVAVDLDDPATATPSFAAPLVKQGASEELTFELVVSTAGPTTGSFDVSVADSVKVTINDFANEKPVAVIDDQTVDEGSFVELDPTLSFDPDGDDLTYEITQTGGVAVTLEANIEGVVSFTAPRVPQGATVELTFELVADDSLAIDTKSFKVTVTDTVNEVVAEAGADQLAVPSGGATTNISVDGSASSDPDGDAIVSYAWEAVNGGKTVTGSGVTTTLALSKGTWTVTLTVSDGEASDTDTLTVEVLNAKPVINAGEDREVASQGATTDVAMLGSAVDPDGDALAIRWLKGAEVVPGADAATSTITLAKGATTLTLEVDDGSGALTDTVVVTVGNAAPTAVATLDGGGTTFNERTTVTLRGDASSDVDGDTIVGYEWTQTAGPALPEFATTVTVANPTFTAPSVTSDTQFAFSLRVTDGTTFSEPATLTLTNKDDVAAVPVAVPTGPTRLGGAETIALDGTGSSDPDGLPLTYTWSQTGGPTATLTGTLDGETTTYLAPRVPYETVASLTFGLTVTNGFKTSAPATVTVEVDDRNNVKPVADAGADQVVGEGTLVRLDGRNSSDADGDALIAGAWTQTVGPTVTLASANGPQPTFTSPRVKRGESVELRFSYVVQTRGRVTGTRDTSDPDEVVVTVNDTLNAAPVARAGSDFSAAEASVVVLDGSASSDLDGDALTFAWRVISPATIELDDPATATPKFTAPRVKQGQSVTVELGLTVNDGAASSVEDVIVVTIDDDFNDAPVALGDGPTSVGEGDLVTLDGSGSSDADGDALTYAWTQSDGPPVTLTGATTATPTFSAPFLSANTPLTFELVVSDGLVESEPSVVTVTVIDTSNLAPTADAGDDEEADEGAVVTLDGSASSDIDGDPITGFTWVQVGGPTVALTGADTASPTFTSPRVAQGDSATLVFELVVSDGRVASEPDTVTVTVNDTLNTVVAVAGDDQLDIASIGTVTAVSVDGSASSDPDGDEIVSYAWAAKRGTTTVNASGGEATLNLPKGTWNVTLTVSDGAAQDSDTLVVTILNAAPVVDAGENQVVASSGLATTNVKLAGSASDLNGDTLTVRWFDGEEVIEGASALDSTVALGKGVHVLTLEVDDGEATASDTVQVTVGNAPPVAGVTLFDNRGPVTTGFINENIEARLSGETSSDPDGEQLTYAWRQTAGRTLTLSASDTRDVTFATPRVTAPEEFGFELTVSDGVASDTATFEFTVDNNNVPPPVADAGNDQTVDEGVTVTLDGSGSFDPDAQERGTLGLAAIEWRQVDIAANVPEVELSDANVASPTFAAPDLLGRPSVELVFEITVRNNGREDSARTTVTVLNSGNQKPTAVAKGPEKTNLRQFQLDGTESADPDGDEIVYQWDLVADGEGTCRFATGLERTKPEPIVIASRVEGEPVECTFALIVNDGSVNSDEATVTVQIVEEDPLPKPGVGAGGDAERDEGDATGRTFVAGPGDEVELDGSDNPATLTYQWAQVELEEGEDPVELRDATLPIARFTVPDDAEDGDLFKFALTVTDGTNSQTSDVITIRVEVEDDTGDTDTGATDDDDDATDDDDDDDDDESPVACEGDFRGLRVVVSGPLMATATAEVALSENSDLSDVTFEAIKTGPSRRFVAQIVNGSGQPLYVGETTVDIPFDFEGVFDVALTLNVTDVCLDSLDDAAGDDAAGIDEGATQETLRKTLAFTVNVGVAGNGSGGDVGAGCAATKSHDSRAGALMTLLAGAAMVLVARRRRRSS